MINRSGYTAFTKNSFSPSYAPKGNKRGGSNSSLFFGVVAKISFLSVGDSYHELGIIEFSDENGNIVGEARPIFSNSFFKYPIEGEQVIIVRNTSQREEGIDTINYYFPSLNLWSNPNSNSVSSIPSLFPGYTFPPYVKSNIHPIFPYTLDAISQGGFGNSIRLGSTNNEGSIPNNWSSTGENYSPIMILMNGQNPTNTNLGYVPITEDINNDLSSIYLTSNQQLQLFPASVNNFSFSKSTPPTNVGQYSENQIILNSGRLVFNAKSDSVLILANKSIQLSCNETLGVDAKQISLLSNEIYLGPPNDPNMQPIVLGDNLNFVLGDIAIFLQTLNIAFKTATDSNGAPIVSLQSIAYEAETLSNDLLNIVNGENLLSKTVKTI